MIILRQEYYSARVGVDKNEHTCYYYMYIIVTLRISFSYLPRNYANVVNNVFGRVFATKVCCMDDYDRANLEQEQVMVIVTSTFGSGDPPANGEVIITSARTL